MINILLTNSEWYFLCVQIEKILTKNPDNHIAKNILNKLAENCPSLNNITCEFKNEYESIWIKD